MIRKSQKPFIFVGGGAVISMRLKSCGCWLTRSRHRLPRFLMGRGAFDGTDELYTGMVGMHGTKTSNFGME